MIKYDVCKDGMMYRSDAWRESHVRSQEITNARIEGRPLKILTNCYSAV